MCLIRSAASEEVIPLAVQKPTCDGVMSVRPRFFAIFFRDLLWFSALAASVASVSDSPSSIHFSGLFAKPLVFKSWYTLRTSKAVFLSSSVSNFSIVKAVPLVAHAQCLAYHLPSSCFTCIGRLHFGQLLHTTGREQGPSHLVLQTSLSMANSNSQRLTPRLLVTLLQLRSGTLLLRCSIKSRTRRYLLIFDCI